HQAGEGDEPIAVHDIARVVGGEPRCHPGEATVLDRDVRDRRAVLVRAREADVLDEKVVLVSVAHCSPPVGAFVVVSPRGPVPGAAAPGATGPSSTTPAAAMASSSSCA